MRGAAFGVAVSVGLVWVTSSRHHLFSVSMEMQLKTRSALPTRLELELVKSNVMKSWQA